MIVVPLGGLGLRFRGLTISQPAGFRASQVSIGRYKGGEGRNSALRKVL